MRIVSWNMGCAPPMAKQYRRSHQEAWLYLLNQLGPDVALVQEALFPAPVAEDFGQIFWSPNRGSDSGAAVVVRRGLPADNFDITAAGSYVAGAHLALSGEPFVIASMHVGPPNYRKHLLALADALSTSVGDRRFVVGGDLNAARHLDDVNGGRWFTAYFDNLAKRNLYDCHWAQHGKEVQSFWGHQAREPYQCDHFFADGLTSRQVSNCTITDNVIVRGFSDHGPLILDIEDGSSRAVVKP